MTARTKGPDRPRDGAPTRDRRFRRFIVLAAVLAVAGVVVLALTAGSPGVPKASLEPSAGTSASATSSSSSASDGPSPTVAASPTASASIGGLAPPGGSDRGYLTSLGELKITVEQARAGQEPQASAVADLMSWASSAIDQPAKPSNPLRIKGTTGPFVDDTMRAYGLALAYGVSGDLRYARAAQAIVDAWVSTTRSTSNTCPLDGSCQTSLIIGRTAPGFVFAVDLIAASGQWTAADDTAFRDWLQTVILPAASLRENNWGDAGLLLRVTATDWLGDQSGFQAALADWRRRIGLIDPGGAIPEETRRGTAGIQYTQEALMYKVAVARIAERRGVDLWSTTGSNGSSLKAAVDLLADYWAHPEDWPYAPNVRLPSPGPMWELAYAHWKAAPYARIIEQDRPFGSEGHSAVRWTTLTSGIPIQN